MMMLVLFPKIAVRRNTGQLEILGAFTSANCVRRLTDSAIVPSEARIGKLEQLYKQQANFGEYIQVREATLVCVIRLI
jgi:hypothetical protein